MGFLYRFLDINNNILYIGKTGVNVVSRLKAHNHLPKECYKQIISVEYAEVESIGDLSILEIYLINKHLPPYNKEGKDTNYTLLKLDTSFLEWRPLDLRACGINFVPEEQHPLTPEEYKERQRAGIERAKAEGKYKGRKRKWIDYPVFVEDCKCWRAGECTATKIFKKHKISSQTFYRRVKEWGL